MATIQEAMRGVVSSAKPRGTAVHRFSGMTINVAGKTGTAEYCDDVARKANRCDFGLWPTHAWTMAYAPFDDPEIIIIAFAYNGGEGGQVAAPIVARIMQAYFELKAIGPPQGGGG